MTKDELSQLQALRMEILDLKKKRADIETRGIPIPVLDGLPHGTGIGDPTGRAGAELASYGIRIDNAMERYLYQLMQIEIFIEECDDSKTRLIMRHRYIDGMTLQEVAFAVGEQDKQYVWWKLKSYLDRMGIK